MKKFYVEFSDEWTITDEWAKAIGDRLNQEFGPGGRVEQIYNYMIAYAAQVAGQLQASMAASGSFGPWLRGGVTEEETSNLRTETPIIDPPNRYFPRPPVPPSNSVSSANSNRSSTQIEVILSPDLEARVINKSLGQMAEVVIETNRQRL